MPLSEDADLALRALALQALEGPCTVPRPAGPGWLGGGGGDATAAAQARWRAWRELGDLPAVEAMRLYVRVLDEECPDWWAAAEAAGLAEAVGEAGLEGAAPPRKGSAGAVAVDAGPPTARAPSGGGGGAAGAWEAVAAFTSSRAPGPRFEHGAALLGEGTSLLVAGGAAPGGRLLGDTWLLNLEDLAWASVGPSSSGGGVARRAPCRRGRGWPWCPGAWARSRWAGTRPGRSERRGPRRPGVDAWSFDPSRSRWSPLPTTGPAPPARGGHVAVRLGGGAPSTILVWGGAPSEGAAARPRGGQQHSGQSAPTDIHLLDLASLTWASLSPGGPAPLPRSGAAGAVIAGRFLVLFGGADPDGSLSAAVDVLDVQAWEWLPRAALLPRGGRVAPRPPARAGHAAAVLGRVIYFVGGGDDAAGRPDAWALDCSRLPASLSWAPAAPPAGPAARAAASEGAALVALPAARALLAFGGNAGRLHADLAVLRLGPGAGGAWEEDGEDEGGGASAPPLPRPLPPPPLPSAAAAAATPADPSELALTRRQLASAQAAAAEAAAREEAALAAAAAERAGRLAAEAEAERWQAEAGRWRAAAEAAGLDVPAAPAEPEPGAKPARGVWAFISGAP